MQFRQIDPGIKPMKSMPRTTGVFFWSRLDTEDDSAWCSDKWEFSEVDVYSGWAAANATSSSINIWVVDRTGGGVNNIRLAGIDPTAPKSSQAGQLSPYCK